jgi:hypothetical protein
MTINVEFYELTLDEVKHFDLIEVKYFSLFNTYFLAEVLRDGSTAGKYKWYGDILEAVVLMR